MVNKIADTWIATVILKSNGDYSNNQRLQDLVKIISYITKETHGDGIVLFPAGYLSNGKRNAKHLYKPA